MAAFYRTLDCAGKELRIKQLYVGDVGCVVWDAALVLARFLENSRHFGKNFWREKAALELGSGTGIVGLAACVLGQVNINSLLKIQLFTVVFACRANVTLTDLDEFVPLISENIDSNRRVLSGTAKAKTLNWLVYVDFRKN